MLSGSGFRHVWQLQNEGSVTGTFWEHSWAASMDLETASIGGCNMIEENVRPAGTWQRRPVKRTPAPCCGMLSNAAKVLAKPLGNRGWHTADLVWIGALKRRGSSEPPRSTAYVGGMRSCFRLKVKIATSMYLKQPDWTTGDHKNSRYVFTPMLSGLRWPGQTVMGSWRQIASISTLEIKLSLCVWLRDQLARGPRFAIWMRIENVLEAPAHRSNSFVLSRPHKKPKRTQNREGTNRVGQRPSRWIPPKMQSTSASWTTDWTLWLYI